MTESYKHADLKYDYFFSILQDDTYADIEKNIGSTRTDVLTEINNHLVAIEIQRSYIGIKKILHRMKEHANKDIYTLWLIPEDMIQTNIVHNYKWIKFIQHIQNGVIFLPTNNQKIIPARIDNRIDFIGDRIIVKGSKILDKHIEIDLQDILFEKNEHYGINISTYPPDWWLEPYLEVA